MCKKAVMAVSILSVLALLLGEITVVRPAEGSMVGQDLAPATSSGKTVRAREESASQTQPSYPDEDPVTLIDDDVRGWAYGGGFLYWAYHCAGFDPVDAFLKRRHQHALWTDVLGEASPPSCDVFSGNMIADQDGVYYLNVHDQVLVSRLTADPETAITIANVDPGDVYLTSDQTYVYHNRADGIYRARKDYYGVARISDATSMTSLAVDGSYIYWLDATGLWRSDKTCITPACWSVKEQLATSGGSYLAWEDEDYILWVQQDGANWRLRRTNVNVGGSGTIYWSPVGTTLQLGRPLFHAPYYFWIEQFVGGTVAVRRLNRDTGVVDTIAEVQSLQVPAGNIAGGLRHVIFGGQHGLYGLPYDATPLSWDLAVEEMEITQAVQSLDNDVELVAGKPTFVRVYGALIAGSNRVNSAQVELRGYRGANELSGSPLLPLDGVQSMAVGHVRDRRDPDEGWLFQLPAHWTQEGTIRLEAAIDPHHMYSDPNSGNDSLTRYAQFAGTTPICLVFSPVKTHAGTEGADNAHFYSMIELAKQIWPTNDFRIYHQRNTVEELEVCLGWALGFIPVPYPCYGPYELPGDTIWILNSLRDRDNLSDDPDECDDAGARTHYIGLVHPSANTGTTLGAARIGISGDYDCDQLWVKLSPAHEHGDVSWNLPRAGLTLAHELGHNYGRQHVDCPVGLPDHIDPDYPYSSCTLDDGDLTDPQTHFGFDFESLLPISPSVSQDVMSYGWTPWVSDYTWGHLFDELNRAHAASAPSAATAAPDLTQSEAAVLVSGAFTTSLGQGHLDYAWVYPTTTLSSGILRKWQRLAAPSWEAASHPEQDVYHLRLLDACGTVLDDRVVSPTTPIDVPEPEISLFSMTFPAPLSDVARLELLINDTVVDSLWPGAGVPAVQVLEPTGGSFDEELTLIWQGSDADPNDDLLYTVQYTPDDGQTWRALLTSFPGSPDTTRVTVTLSSFSDLPGGANARLRVIASDGYHTSMDTSASFWVVPRKPQPYIIPPDAEVAAGRPVLLHGGASDAEEGSVADGALQWAVDGHDAFTGTAGVLQGLAPGSHAVSLVATDSSGLTGTTRVSVTVSPLHIAQVPYWAEQPELDGLCDDEAYTRGTMVPLEPYDEVGQGSVRLVRTVDSLWACFSGMAHGVEDPMSFAGLMADVNYSREGNPQEGDLAFLVYEDGTPATWVGLPGGGFDLDTWAGGLQTSVFVSGTVWHAELRIDSDNLDGWGHVVGLEPVHFCPSCLDITHLWPYETNYTRPADWATTVLGDWPQLSYMDPDERIAGQPGVSLFVYGQAFDDDAVLYWDGDPQTTVVWDDTIVSTMLTAGDLAVAGTAKVTVVNPGLELVPSNALLFTIVNPTPTITALDPVSATAGTPHGFTLHVTGTGFVPGAQVQWNGEPCATTYVSSTLVTGKIPPEYRAASREVYVLVRNPMPNDGASNAVRFTLVRPAAPYSIYLPLLARGG